MSKSIFCDYNDAYISVRGNITTIGCNLLTEVAFKNCAPFIKCIIKIYGTTTDDPEDLDLVMLMYNLLKKLFKKRLHDHFLWMGFNCFIATEPIQGDSLEYSSNYSGMRGSLWVFF